MYAHEGISATCGGAPLFGVKNRASHLSVSHTTLEKLWRIGTGTRGWRGRAVLGNDHGGVFSINLMLRGWRVKKNETSAVGEV